MSNDAMDITPNGDTEPVDNGKPFAKDASAAESGNNSDTVEDITIANGETDEVEIDEAYEEDPLPHHLNPAGIYSHQLYKKQKRDDDAKFYVALPPKTTGGPQAGTRGTSVRCACRGSQCIRLYCDCFAAAQLCTDHCRCLTQCANDGAPENEISRTRSILNVFQSMPYAFRHTDEQMAEKSVSTINAFISNQRAGDSAPPATLETLRCSCRKSKCLKAYCMCWSNGAHCNDKCTCVGCVNLTGSVDHAVLVAQSCSCKTSRCLRAFCSCWSNGTNCTAACSCSSCENRVMHVAMPPQPVAGTLSAVAVSKKSAPTIPRPQPRAIPLPPSAFATPALVEDRVVQGLSFGRALPPEQPESRQGPVTSPSSRRLYHNLMLSPSRLGARRQDSNTSDPKSIGTELEVAWSKERHDVVEFFRIMKHQVENRVYADTEKAAVDEGPNEKRVRAVLASVEDDIKNVDRVIEAAELDTLTRIRGRKRRSSLNNAEWMEDKERDEEVAGLKCDEQILLPEENESTGAALKEMTILAAQDTALLRETARIIRRKARELCERRMLKQNKDLEEE